MKSLLLVAALVANEPVLVQPDNAGGRLELYADSTGCDYGWLKGSAVNSANLVTMDFCWRLRRDTGQVVFDNGHDASVEEFNLSANGLVWIRRYVL